MIRPFNEVLLPIPENRQRIIAPRALLRSQGLDATELYPEAPELAHSYRRAVAQMALVVSAVRRYRDVGQKTARNPYGARPSCVSHNSCRLCENSRFARKRARSERIFATGWLLIAQIGPNLRENWAARLSIPVLTQSY